MSTLVPLQMAGGIGSLPFFDAQQACQFSLANLPELPHWVQLPRLGEREGFVRQFLAPLEELGIIQLVGNKLLFNPEDNLWSQQIAQFYENYLLALEQPEAKFASFALPVVRGRGFYAFLEAYRQQGRSTPFIKGQISGPVTVGMQIRDPQGIGAYYHPQLRDLLVKSLALQAGWQTQTLGTLGAQPVVFVDDPGIYNYGHSSHLTLTKEQIRQDFEEIYTAIRQSQGLTGTHACAGADWSILLESSVDIISFDAYNYFATLLPYAGLIQQFLARGGVLAWGIVPTSQQIWQEDVNSLREKFMQFRGRLVNYGVDEKLLATRWLITPSCGTGLLSIEQTQRIYALTVELADSLKNFC